MTVAGRDPHITRRAFLVGSGMAAGAAIVAACGSMPPAPAPSSVESASSTSSAGPAPGVDLSDPPFGLWRALRETVRQSPDHLPMAAEAAVASADPERIFAFVRDHIATLPPDAHTFYAATSTAIRWGTRATLRGGAGTPRERAELLASLYREAGFDARVVTGSSTLGEADVRRALTRPIDRVFQPQVSIDDLRAWVSASGVTAPPSSEPFDPDGTRSIQLATTLLPLLGSTADVRPTDFHPLDMPFVEVMVGGKPTIADPFLPDAQLGRSYVTGSPAPAAAATPALPVHLEVAVASALRPWERNVVLSADWTADQLAGRQLIVDFTPPGPAGSALTLPPRDLTIVIPTVIVQAIDLDAGSDPDLSVAGTAFTIGGEPVAVADDGTTALGGRSGAISAGDAGAVARVATIDARVDAGRFPVVEVAVTPRDAAGNEVTGLGADQLALAEDGVERGYLLVRDHVPPPRVLLLFDTSGSMPPGYSGPALAAFGSMLGRRIASEITGVELAATTLLGAPAWTSDPSVLDQQLSALGLGGPDALWHGVVAAAATEPDVIVLITDGESTDEVDDTLGAAVASGPPVVGLCVAGPSGLPALTAIAAASGGVAAQATQATAADRALTGIATVTTAAAPYRLRYRAVEGEPPQRTVAVSIRGSSAPPANATYGVPAPSIRAQRRGLGRLELTLAVGDEQVTRVLAGSHATDAAAVVTPEEADEAWAALFGTVLIAFEAGDPSTGQLLDDLLTAALARQPLADALASGDDEAVMATLADGSPELPIDLVSLLGPVGGADGSSLTFPLGLRVTLLRTGPRLAGGASEHADILPLSRWTTIGPDPAASFRLTMQRTARVAILEQAAFLSSTASVLAGAPLRMVEPNLPLSAGGQLDDATALALDAIDDPAYRSDIRLVLADGRPDGYWAVDPETGTVWGVLPDGSGGGASAYDQSGKPAGSGAGSTGDQLGRLNNVGSAVGAGVTATASAFGVPLGVGPGLILVIGIATARQYIRAASYLTVNPSDDPSTNAKEVRDLACKVGRIGTKSLVDKGAQALGATKTNVQTSKELDTYAGAMGLNPFSC